MAFVEWGSLKWRKKNIFSIENNDLNVTTSKNSKIKVQFIKKTLN